MSDYFLETQHHEWILTNKYGSYALGTGNLINQRKYHGLLTASDKKLNRASLLTSIEEQIEWRGEKLYLDSCNYENCIYPEGFLHLVKSWLRPYPVFLYSSLPHNNDILIRKEIKMDYETNTVMISYKNLSKHLIHMKLRPKVDMVSHHYLNQPGSLNENDFAISTAQGNNFFGGMVNRLSNNLSLYCLTNLGEIRQEYMEYKKVFYPWESMLGYDCNEDLVSPFSIRFDLEKNQEVTLLFSDSPIEEHQVTISRINDRYSDLPMPRDYPDNYRNFDLMDLDFNDQYLYTHAEYMKILDFSLKDFITDNDIIAGYPWFGAWGRDSVLVLSAMIKQADMVDKAEKIILRFNDHIKAGLIPNMFPETGSEGNYDSVDTSLYYIILLRKLASLRKSKEMWEKLISITENILLSYLNEDRRMFYLDQDNLINIKEDFAGVTWMDVKIEGKAVTPRDGAPVEINFLWYEAHKSYQEMIEKYNSLTKKNYQAKYDVVSYTEKLAKSLQKFWHNNSLCDRITNNIPIDEFRPNAVIAAGLKYAPLSEEQLKLIYERATNELLTPYGLRTLSPNHHKFKRTYYGTILDRDKAYHQGTVWAWLLWPYTSLYLRLFKNKVNKKELIEGLESIIKQFRHEYKHGYIASIASIWDGGKPHFPKGAPAEAWSVAAVYDIEKIIEKLKENKE